MILSEKEREVIMSLLFGNRNKGKEYIDQKYGTDVKAQPKDTLVGLFSIYDIIAEEYNPPFVAKNLKTAIRSIRESVQNNKQNLLAIHPEDYKLVHIADFDNSDASIYPCVLEEQLLKDIIIAKDKES